VYLVLKLRKLLKKQINSMKKPELLKQYSNGSTIHSYQLSGGRTTYDRYLACNKGHCTFFDSMELAETGLEKMT
tara:strand:+ start:655 stop:876 length:222 start_codon:yes stop_codon:yes gene_type:complete